MNKLLICLLIFLGVSFPSQESEHIQGIAKAQNEPTAVKTDMRVDPGTG